MGVYYANLSFVEFRTMILGIHVYVYIGYMVYRYTVSYFVLSFIYLTLWTENDSCNGGASMLFVFVFESKCILSCVQVGYEKFLPFPSDFVEG